MLSFQAAEHLATIVRRDFVLVEDGLLEWIAMAEELPDPDDRAYAYEIVMMARRKLGI